MIVLDTNAWLWWLHDPKRLGTEANRAILKATQRGRANLSAISVWEVALKTASGKLRLPLEFDEWWENARSYPGITITPVEVSDAIVSVQLPESVPSDPADRFIVALTCRLGASLVTADEKLHRCGVVKTIW